MYVRLQGIDGLYMYKNACGRVKWQMGLKITWKYSWMPLVKIAVWCYIHLVLQGTPEIKI